MPKKKLSKAEKKAKKLQDATDNLAIVLDRAQLAVNNAAPEDDVSVLKAVIDKKRAAFAKLGQRPSEEAMARLCPNCKAAQPKDEPPTCAACEAKTKEKHKYDPARIETKEIRAFMAALPPAPPPGAEPPEAYDGPVDRRDLRMDLCCVPPKKKISRRKKAKKAQDARQFSAAPRRPRAAAIRTCQGGFTEEAARSAAQEARPTRTGMTRAAAERLAFAQMYILRQAFHREEGG